MYVYSVSSIIVCICCKGTRVANKLIEGSTTAPCRRCCGFGVLIMVVNIQ